jgi:hypothetical protein
MQSIVLIYMRSIVLFICGGGLFVVYNALYFFRDILVDKYPYHEPLFIMTCILLCLILCLMNL